ncbi:branched-chain amino acid ABC transporter permease [Sulfitobacter alexandrii]|uniref:branched-chain amino acid ABC transporter permease n=1 Tax=Sulfitobacter alexandrii TaxID=1917485 RepID=UPI0009FAC872|nr:branched-chain amino acid ABC transporter permease [Sulfitobacter alexandrii]
MSITRINPAQFFAIMAVLVLGGFVLPHVANRGIVFLGGVVAINMVFGIAFNIAFQKAGILSFGNAMFFATGAYATGYMITTFPQVPFLLMIALSGLAGALLALVTGLLALRRSSGVYFAVITLAVGELIHVLITKMSFLGRNDGMVGVFRPSLDFGVFAIDLGEGDAYYCFIIVFCALLISVLWVLWSNRFGRAMQTVKSDAMRADFLGTDVNTKRLQALVLSGAATALAGALFAPWAQIVTPDLAHWSQSTKPLLFALLGGTAFFFGPVVGAILFSLLEYNTRALVGISDLMVGGLLLAVVLAVPGGVLGLLRTIYLGGRAAATRSRQEEKP